MGSEPNLHFMTLTLIHTADVHRLTFNTLRDQLAPEAALTHLVRPDWLAQAQAGISEALRDEVGAAIDAAEGPVLCSCTSLGPIAEAFGAIRIDQPMMRAAAETGGRVLIAYCLRSTEAPSLSLLERELQAAGNMTPAAPLFLGQHWPLFDAGDLQGFATALSQDIRHAAGQGQYSAIVLAQASMAGAAAALQDLPCPVLTSPELALRAALSGAI